MAAIKAQVSPGGAHTSIYPESGTQLNFNASSGYLYNPPPAEQYKNLNVKAHSPLEYDRI